MGLIELNRYVQVLRVTLYLFDFALSQAASLPPRQPYNPLRAVDRRSELESHKRNMRQTLLFSEWQRMAAREGVFAIIRRGMCTERPQAHCASKQ